MIDDAFREVLDGYLQSNHRKKVEIIERAFRFAKAAHSGIRRRSGEPYILHPIAVAKIASQEIGLGSTSICAALLHDVGKISTFTLDETGRGHFYGHAAMSAETADTILRRLKAPNALREGVATLIRHHMTRLEEDKRLLKRRIRSLGWETVEQLLQLQEADMGSKGTGEEQDFDQFRRIRALLEEIRAENACLTLRDLAVNGKDMMALGLRGAEIGKTLNTLLDAVLEKRLPNDREALLRYAGEMGLSLMN